MHHANDRITRGVDRRPDVRADSCQNRRAICGAFFRLDDFDVVIVDIRLNLTPKRGTRTAAAKSNALHRNFHLTENCERILQAVSDSFENRANDVGALVRRGQPDQSATSTTIKMRRALAHQVRSPKEPVGSRGRRRAIRLAAANGVIGIASVAAVYLQQRHVTVAIYNFGGWPPTLVKQHPSWEDPVAIGLSIGGFALAVAILTARGGYFARRR